MPVITSAGNGNWSAGGTWIGGVPPTIDDDVVIAGVHIVDILDENAEALSITIAVGAYLRMRCFGGPTKIQFKDDPAAALTVNGNLQLLDQTAVKSATIMGGSDSNKTVWTVKGPIYNNGQLFLHIGYLDIRFQWQSYGTLYVDYSIKTRQFIYDWQDGIDSYIIPHGENLVLHVDVQTDIAERLYVNGGHTLHIQGTSDYSVEIKGTDATHRLFAAPTMTSGGRVIADYLIANQHLYYGVEIGKAAASIFRNCTIEGEWGCIIGHSTAPIYFENCDLRDTYRVIRDCASHLIFKNCDFTQGDALFEGYGGLQVDLIGDLKNDISAITLAERGRMFFNWFKEITVTVLDAAGDPIEGAYVTIIQENVEDYETGPSDFDYVRPRTLEASGITDASGEVLLLGLHMNKIVDAQTSILTQYFSDSVQNGPGGSPENHKLIVHSWGYVSHEEDVVCDADKAVTVTLGSLSLPELTVEIEDQELEVVIA